MISFEVRAIITDVEKMSHIAKTRFLEFETPLIERNTLKSLKSVDEFAIIDKSELEEKLTEWKNAYDQLVKEKTQDMLQKIIRNYRKQKLEEASDALPEDAR